MQCIVTFGSSDGCGIKIISTWLFMGKQIENSPVFACSTFWHVSGLNDPSHNPLSFRWGVLFQEPADEVSYKTETKVTKKPRTCSPRYLSFRTPKAMKEASFKDWEALSATLSCICRYKLCVSLPEVILVRRLIHLSSVWTPNIFRTSQLLRNSNVHFVLSADHGIRSLGNGLSRINAPSRCLFCLSGAPCCTRCEY